MKVDVHEHVVLIIVAVVICMLCRSYKMLV